MTDRDLIEELTGFVGLSASEVARQAGLTPSTLTRPLHQPVKHRLSTPTLDKLRAAWPNFPGWGTLAPLPAANAVPFKMEGASDRRMREDVPVYGTALGAEEIVDGEAIEQTTLNTGETIAYFKRPVLLEGRAEIYGIFVQGSSMSPRYKDGEKAFVDPKRPPRIGDDVVVYLRQPDEIDGERDCAVLVKELVRQTSTYIELLQHTPPKTFRLPRERYSKVHRIVPPSEWID